MRAVVTALLVALFVALQPAEALGWTAFRNPGDPVLHYRADSGESNAVTISLAADTYTITDLGPNAAAVTTISPPCTRIDDQTVTCPAPGITQLEILTIDMNDSAVVDANTPAVMEGGDGNDTITGGGGNDFIRGDAITGGQGHDRVAGGAGNDVLVGKSDTADDAGNELDGGPDDDELWGAGGPDSLAGGGGSDQLRGFGGDDTGDGGDGRDFVAAGDGNDSFDGGAGDDELGIGRVQLLVVPEWGDDRFNGGAGDDVIQPGPGPLGERTDNDVLRGGAGRDVVTYSQRLVDLAISLDGQSNDGAAGERDDVGPDFERLEGGGSDDRIAGSAGPDEIDGGQGADVIAGSEGADTLDGGASDAESDTLHGDGGPDLLRGNAGDDELNGGAGTDDLQGGEGDDSLEGGDDADGMTGGPGIDGLLGGAGNDRLLGESADDTLRGDSGNDEVLGGDGNDVLTGGQDDDLLGGGPDTDTADYGIAARALTVTLDGAANDGEPGERDNVQFDVENVVGGGLEDTLFGSAGPNLLNGRAGEDYLDGAGGAGDDLIGGSAIDVVRTRDGQRDAARCGRGKDLAIVDRADRVTGSCERQDDGIGNVPELGREVVVRPVRGANQFGLPAMRRTVPLQDRINLPVGTEFDSRTGAVRIVSAGRRGAGGRASAAARRRSAGVFSGGRFTVRQRRSGEAATELRLTGGDFSQCRSATVRRSAAAAQLPRRIVRRLNTRARGRHRVAGNHSAGTTRGTVFSVIDRCDGTLTRVRRGAVVVRDFRLRRTVVVRAGERYLARAPGG
jgi:Ca2+-binding RTX toxin-like protein